MKRCIFSNEILTEFKWVEAGDYVCYFCHARHSNEKTAHHLAGLIRLGVLLDKVAAQERKKKKSPKNPWIPKTKVDRRIVESQPPPVPLALPVLHGFSARPKVEGPAYPKITYPYITSLGWKHPG